MWVYVLVPPPRLDETVPVPPGGGKEPRRRQGGGKKGPRGTGGATPPIQLGFWGLGHRGGASVPRDHKRGARTVKGKDWGGGIPHN